VVRARAMLPVPMMVTFMAMLLSRCPVSSWLA
jgi:hypothetical protein